MKWIAFCFRSRRSCISWFVREWKITKVHQEKLSIRRRALHRRSISISTNQNSIAEVALKRLILYIRPKKKNRKNLIFGSMSNNYHNRHTDQLIHSFMLPFENHSLKLCWHLTIACNTRTLDIQFFTGE